MHHQMLFKREQAKKNGKKIFLPYRMIRENIKEKEKKKRKRIRTSFSKDRTSPRNLMIIGRF